MRFAAAEPEFVLLIEVADVSHAMPEGVSVGNFGERGGFWSSVVFPSSGRTANDDFADLSEWQWSGVVDGRDGLIGSFDNSDIDVTEGSTDAGSFADGGECGSVIEDLPGAD